MKKKKSKMGRPRKPADEKFSEVVNIKMTRAERAFVERESEKAGLSMASYIMRPIRARKVK